MGDPKAFVAVERARPHTRPVALRTRDYKSVYESLPPDELRTQASRCMDCGVPFCNTGCPLGNLVPEWNDLVYRDEWHAALQRLQATNNFPEFTGALCPAPCESACVLSINNQPVTIKEVEHSIIDRGFDNGWLTPRVPAIRTGRKIAVVGSGPAGLAAADQLNQLGHSVTVFEKDDRIGGLLTYGIPDFKIEKWVVERRVQLLADEGIAFVTGAHVGESPSFAQLQIDFDAVLLAVGALASRDVEVAGRELGGIHMAMDYLVQQNRRVAGLPVDADPIVATGKHVVIIGGGDTGADCLGNVHRERCASVQVLTHGVRPPDHPDALEWPDVPFVLRTWPAHEEGGERVFEAQITRFSGSAGMVERVHSVDGSGREHVLDADLVLLAIGFTGPVQDALFARAHPELDGRGVIAHDHYATSIPGVFVAGDAMRGASLVVWAIADGRKAAAAIDDYLFDRATNFAMR